MARSTASRGVGLPAEGSRPRVGRLGGSRVFFQRLISNGASQSRQRMQAGRDVVRNDNVPGSTAGPGQQPAVCQVPRGAKKRGKRGEAGERERSEARSSSPRHGAMVPGKVAQGEQKCKQTRGWRFINGGAIALDGRWSDGPSGGETKTVLADKGRRSETPSASNRGTREQSGPSDTGGAGGVACIPWCSGGSLPPSRRNVLPAFPAMDEVR